MAKTSGSTRAGSSSNPKGVGGGSAKQKLSEYLSGQNEKLVSYNGKSFTVEFETLARDVYGYDIVANPKGRDKERIESIYSQAVGRPVEYSETSVVNKNVPGFGTFSRLRYKFKFK